MTEHKQTPAPGPQLSAEELGKIPDMGRLRITWSGGNGPHEYIARWVGDTLWAFMPNNLQHAVDPIFSRGDKVCLHKVEALFIPPPPESQVLPPAVTGQMEIDPDVTAADMGVNAEPAEDDIGPYEQALRDAVEPFLDWLEQREEGAHIREVREGLIGVEDVIPDDHVVLGAHLRAQKDQGVLTIGHFRKLQAAYDGKVTPSAETRPATYLSVGLDGSVRYPSGDRVAVSNPSPSPREQGND